MLRCVVKLYETVPDRSIVVFTGTVDLTEDQRGRIRLFFRSGCFRDRFRRCFRRRLGRSLGRRLGRRFRRRIRRRIRSRIGRLLRRFAGRRICRRFSLTGRIRIRFGIGRLSYIGRLRRRVRVFFRDDVNGDRCSCLRHACFFAAPAEQRQQHHYDKQQRNRF